MITPHSLTKSFLKSTHWFACFYCSFIEIEVLKEINWIIKKIVYLQYPWNCLPCRFSIWIKKRKEKENLSRTHTHTHTHERARTRLSRKALSRNVLFLKRKTNKPFLSLDTKHWITTTDFQDSPGFVFVLFKHGGLGGPNIRSHVCVLFKKPDKTEGLQKAELCHAENTCFGAQRGAQTRIQTLLPGALFLFKNVDSSSHSF